MDKCIGDQKKVNKKEKQLKMKLMQEELKYQKNQKALKRMNKVVVGGRKVPMIFNLKNFNTQNKTRNSEKSDEKLNIYDITGDKDENEEK